MGLQLLLGVEREPIDVLTRLGNDQAEDRVTLAGQLLHDELHGRVAESGMFESDRVSQEIPERFLVVSLAMVVSPDYLAGAVPR